MLAKKSNFVRHPRDPVQGGSFSPEGAWLTENLAGYPTPAEGTWRVGHVQATFQIGNVLGAVNDDAGAFGVSAEFVFPVAKFLAPGSGEGAAQ